MRVYHYVALSQFRADHPELIGELENALGAGKLALTLQLFANTPAEKALAGSDGVIQWINGADLYQLFGLDSYSHPL